MPKSPAHPRTTPTEDTEQIHLMQWAAWQSAKYPELELLYHVPNEGKRSRAYGGKLKAMGLKAGVPDICLPVARGRYHGLYIELKAGRNKTTDAQDFWLAALAGQGYMSITCWGWEEASKAILAYLRQGPISPPLQKIKGANNHDNT